MWMYTVATWFKTLAVLILNAVVRVTKIKSSFNCCPAIVLSYLKSQKLSINDISANTKIMVGMKMNCWWKLLRKIRHSLLLWRNWWKLLWETNNMRKGMLNTRTSFDTLRPTYSSYVVEHAILFYVKTCQFHQLERFVCTDFIQTFSEIWSGNQLHEMLSIKCVFKF